MAPPPPPGPGRAGPTRRAVLAAPGALALLATAGHAATPRQGAPRMTMVEAAPGVAVHVEDLNPPDARATIVFVHGWPVSHRMFEYQAEALPARGIRCVGIDLRGFGRSDKPWAGLDYDGWADDIRAVIDALSLRGATLAGFSMGGAVSMHYMARHRQHGVGRLALLAAAGPCLGLRPDNPGGIPREAHDGFIQAAREDRARLNAEFGKALFEKPSSPEVDRWLWDMGMQASLHATVRGVEELRNRDLRPGLAGITVPTLVLHGRQDKVIPYELGAGVQGRLIKGARVVPLDGVGHGLFLDARDRVTEELARFATGSA